MNAIQRKIAVALGIVAASLACMGSAAADVPAPAPYQPGDQVWTSEPPASQGSFAPDASWSPPTLPKSPRPWQPGNKVWTSEPPVTELGPLSDGCTRVPATGYIGPGVYASTSSKYSVFWDWSGSSSGQPFHWYIFTSSDVLKAHGYSSGGGGSQSVTANNHYWKVQNQGSVGQAWTVCWND